MTAEHDLPLNPPTNGVIQRGRWAPVPDDDRLVNYIVAHYWDQPHPPRGWQIARMSGAAHIYRERETRWAVVAKFYAAKTGDDAPHYAQREYDMTLQARSAGLSAGEFRALRPLAVWRGVLLLEHVDGLTLEDMIAVRRHRPGELLPALDRAARLLATLHAQGIQPNSTPDFVRNADYARKMVEQLARWGVLKDNATVCNGLFCLIERWETNPAMHAYVPALIHGDATTTNFVYPWQDGVVGIDWERMKETDPAADVGRLTAEIAHSITAHGGSVAEALPLVEHVIDAYFRAAGHADETREAFTQRVRFFRATSTLRIARNGWVPRVERMAMVAEALALLADCTAW